MRFLRTRALRPELVQTWYGHSGFAVAAREGMPGPMRRVLAEHLAGAGHGRGAEALGRQLVLAILRATRGSRRVPVRASSSR